MKKHGVILLIIVFIFSCSKDDTDMGSPIQADLSGLWAVTSYSYEANTAILGVDEIVLTNFTDFFSSAGTMNLTMVFNASGDYSFSGFYYLENYVYPNEGQAYYFADYHTVDEQGSWNLNGNKLDVTIDGEQRRIGISELTETRLILRVNTNDSEVDENQTTTTRSKQETYVLQRQ